MHVTVCPAAVVKAPVEEIWRLLVSPEGYTQWADLELVRAEPPGEVTVGQHMEMRTHGMGRWWRVGIDVKEVRPDRHLLALDVSLPLGLVNHEVMTLDPRSERETLVRFN